MNIEQMLTELGLELPPPPAPAGSYVPTIRTGNLLYVAGQLPIKDGKVTHVGQVGKEQTIETAQEAARVATLNTLAAIKGAVGSLDAIKQFVFVNGFVNGVNDFPDSPAVLNGASDLIAEVFGEKGKHARAAVAVAGLPFGAAVEVQVVVEIED
ncbi:MAG TPA: RidA family protein [Opitutales bacterium]|nr:RidA family protein [Opitutales bacterium]